VLDCSSVMRWMVVAKVRVHVQVTADQMIQAQGPLEVFTSLHEKHCLVVGQGKILDIADEYPLLSS